VIYTKETAQKTTDHRTNKEIVKEINVPATPQMGARTPAGKPDSYNDALHQRPGVSGVETVTQAKETPGVAKKCLDAELGRGTPSGGILGDATTQPQAGGEVDYKRPEPRTGGLSPKKPKDFDSKKLP